MRAPQSVDGRGARLPLRRAAPSGRRRPRAIAVEAPVEFVIGGAPFAVMMATPLRPRGFRLRLRFDRGHRRARSRTSAASRSRRADDGLARQARAQRARASGASRAQARDRRAHRLRPVRRRGSSTSCRGRAPVAPPAAPSRPPRSARRSANSTAAQPLNALTRAVHAAAWCGLDGRSPPSRGRRTPQCARQGDRRALARRASRRTADSSSSPAAARSRWSPRPRFSARRTLVARVGADVARARRARGVRHCADRRRARPTRR